MSMRDGAFTVVDHARAYVRLTGSILERMQRRTPLAMHGTPAFRIERTI